MEEDAAGAEEETEGENEEGVLYFYILSLSKNPVSWTSRILAPWLEQDYC